MQMGLILYTDHAAVSATIGQAMPTAQIEKVSSADGRRQVGRKAAAESVHYSYSASYRYAALLAF